MDSVSNNLRCWLLAFTHAGYASRQRVTSADPALATKRTRLHQGPLMGPGLWEGILRATDNLGASNRCPLSRLLLGPVWLTACTV